tara:strand:- start:2863 stop:3339 length:477 start_codon:yes stop_codon:yes gene_type:complete
MGLPNGNNRKYYLNKKNRVGDLKLLSQSKISFIIKHWENNILQTSKEIPIEDKYVIDKIDLIKEYIKKTTKNDMYFAWMPKSVYNDVIFLVVCDINMELNAFNVKYILHSPYWEEKQIKSIHLKYALEDLIEDIEDLNLDLTYLYENDKRYKLDWCNL